MLRLRPRGSSLPAVHVVIMGCGRVGASLAQVLDERGHTVAVVDRDPLSFRKLGSVFGGTTVTGVGFDRDTLSEAGIDGADAFAAVSSGDNSNIISARVARETYSVPTVVARIYDPRRAEIYQRLGIPTVATIRWTTDQALRHLDPGGVQEDYRDPSGRVVLAQLHPHPGWIGQPLRRLELETGARVAFLTRLGQGTLPHSESVLQEGDLLHVLSVDDELGRVESSLAQAPDGR
jgi:trk system potassium uptake protein TrkA